MNSEFHTQEANEILKNSISSDTFSVFDFFLINSNLTNKVQLHKHVLKDNTVVHEMLDHVCLDRKDIVTDEFKFIILECLRCKLRTHRDILLALISNDLPLEHFYVQGQNIVNKPKYKWILDEIIKIRTVTRKWYFDKHGFYPNIPLTFVN